MAEGVDGPLLPEEVLRKQKGWRRGRDSDGYMKSVQEMRKTFARAALNVCDVPLVSM